MGCRCRERGQALQRIARAVVEGEAPAKPVAEDLRFVATSAFEDVAKTVGIGIAAARATLARRR